MVPGLSAQQQAQPAQEQEQTAAPEKFAVSKTYDEAIARFPENLRTGFEGLYAALIAMGQTEEKALQVLHIYLALNHVKVNIIDAGKADVMLPNQTITYSEFYNTYRATAIEGFNHLSPAISVLGNPFDTADWDQWYTDFEGFI
jgi:hypothetical protein